ncbi:dihydroneopterin aldolase [Pseudoclavibacter soli]|uniref:dihydroneopterin aldolase n=1 Tax=Pseudoclavibacter soli TaxID=452623 RepID=UPI0004064CB7|nr:dihydroneopterin aldolase [Pseudoclavibacter soli]
MPESKTGCTLDVIALRGIRARGRHGVFEAEQQLGQTFIVDVDLYVDLARAAATDDLACTVDYGAVALRVVERITGAPVALIERLAALIVDDLLVIDGVHEVTVTVHKPQAPITVPFDDVSVRLHRAREYRGGADA